MDSTMIKKSNMSLSPKDNDFVFKEDKCITIYLVCFHLVWGFGVLLGFVQISATSISHGTTKDSQCKKHVQIDLKCISK